MDSRSPCVVWALGLLTLTSVGCGASPGNDLFGGGAKGILPEAAATGGTASFGGAGSAIQPDGSTGTIPAGTGGAPGTDSDAGGGGTRSGPDASGGSRATDAAPPCTASRFYADLDGDGFGDATHPIEACTAPPHAVKNSGDCYDGNADAHPGQTVSFDVDRGDGSFDYDCNGAGTPDVTVIGRCGSVPFCSGTPGWRASSPECGQSGTWLATCTGFTTICGQTMETRVQKCK
jgi:hypothetical protein